MDLIILRPILTINHFVVRKETVQSIILRGYLNLSNFLNRDSREGRGSVALCLGRTGGIIGMVSEVVLPALVALDDGRDVCAGAPRSALLVVPSSI